jgi:hypothetical protein
MNILQDINQVLSPKVAQMANTELKLYKFKKTFDAKEEDMETVVAISLEHAINQRPKMLQWFIHSITK